MVLSTLCSGLITYICSIITRIYFVSFVPLWFVYPLYFFVLILGLGKLSNVGLQSGLDCMLLFW